MLSDEPDLVATTGALRPSHDRAMDRFELAVATVAVLAAVLLALAR